MNIVIAIYSLILLFLAGYAWVLAYHFRRFPLLPNDEIFLTRILIWYVVSLVVIIGLSILLATGSFNFTTQ